MQILNHDITYRQNKSYKNYKEYMVCKDIIKKMIHRYTQQFSIIA